MRLRIIVAEIRANNNNKIPSSLGVLRGFSKSVKIETCDMMSICSSDVESEYACHYIQRNGNENTSQQLNEREMTLPVLSAVSPVKEDSKEPSLANINLLTPASAVICGRQVKTMSLQDSPVNTSPVSSFPVSSSPVSSLPVSSSAASSLPVSSSPV